MLVSVYMHLWMKMLVFQDFQPIISFSNYSLTMKDFSGVISTINGSETVNADHCCSIQLVSPQSFPIFINNAKLITVLKILREPVYYLKGDGG